ncbi:hypothetical protein [Nocardioides sp.]|uniref:hypothetical protein n=1 Tax=Nocardioides sp. TaxID=35761 RepID=UPI003D150963
MNLTRNGNVGRRLVVSAAVACLTLGLGACSGSDPDEPGAAQTSAATKPTDATSEDAAGDEPSSTQVEPSMGEDFDGILADVATKSCPTDKGDVKASGTVMNSKDDARDILVSVVWLKKDSGDSVAINYVELKDVPAGESATWSVPASLDRKAGRCLVSAKSNKVGTLG